MYKNATFVFCSKVFGSGLYFLVNYIMILCLVESEYAMFSFYISIVPLVAFVFNLGSNKSFLILLKRKDVGESEWVLVKVAAVLIPFVSCILFWFWDTGSEINLVVCAGITIAAIEFALVVLQVKLSFKIYALMNIMRNSFWMIFIVFHFLLIQKINLQDSLNYLALSSLFCFVISTLYLLSNITYRNSLPHILAASKSVVALSKNYFWVELSLTIMMRMEVWILAVFIWLGIILPKELANFSAAFSFAFVLPMLTTSLYKALLPALLEKTEDDLEEYLSKLKNKAAIIVIFALSVTVLGSGLIYLVLPRTYVGAIIPFAIVSLAVSVSFFTNLYQIALIKLGRDDRIKLVTLKQLLLSLPLAILLIYLLGAIGAALSVACVRLIGFKWTMKEIADANKYRFKNIVRAGPNAVKRLQF